MGFETPRSLFLTFLMFLHYSISTRAQNYIFCGGSTNYTRNSTYETNLHSLSSYFFSSQTATNGFFNTSIGTPPNTVYAAALCRADSQPETCRSCILNATIEILRDCSFRTMGIIFSELCTLRYSNQYFFGTMAMGPVLILVNPVYAANPEEFLAVLTKQLDGLRLQATEPDAMLKVGAGAVTVGSSNVTIYSLLQCTPDISPNDCNQCLVFATSQLPNCCYGRQGARVLLPGCTLRYEIFPFFNLTRIQEVQGVLTSPPPQSFEVPSSSPSPRPSPPSPLSAPSNGSCRPMRSIMVIVGVLTASSMFLGA